MTPLDIVAELAAAHAPLGGLVPAANMQKGALPKGAVRALLLQTISVVPVKRLKDTVTVGWARIRVTARADTYDGVGLILDQVRAACGDRRGPIAGFAWAAVTLDAEGPDFANVAETIFERSQDFRVAFRRPPSP